MRNEEYLRSVGITPMHENYTRCLNILESYGENRWWLSSDAKTRAYYQTEELVRNDLLLCPSLENYQLDLYALLNRPVSSLEFTELFIHKLLREVQEAMIAILVAQGQGSEAEEVRQRWLQEAVHPQIESLREEIEKKGGFFFMSEESRKNLGSP